MARNFKFPLQRGVSDGYFELTQTTLEAIKQNLIMFFAVDEGERVVFPELGSKFRKFLFEPDTKTIQHKCENEVERIFSNYFPQLNLDRLQIEVLESDTSQSTIKISISYSFKNLEALNDSLTVVIG